MRKIIAIFIVLLMSLSLVVVGCGDKTETQSNEGKQSADNTQGEKQEEVKTYTINITSPLAEGAAQSKGLIAWTQELEKRTNGQVKIGQITWNGATLKATNILEGLGDGVVDAAFVSNVYHPTKTPLSNALQPVFIDDLANAAPVMQELYNTVPELREEWLQHNVVPVAWFNGADQVLMTDFEFDTMEELKGKKVRAIGRVMPEAISRLGGIPVSISSADSYGALDKGTVDGIAGFPAYALVSNKMAEVSKQITDFRYGGWCQWFGIAFNKDVYDELPDNVKQVIAEIAAIPGEVETQANYDDAMEGFKMARELGQRIVQLTPEEAKRWQDVIDPPSVWEDGIKAAEEAGYENVRELMDTAVTMLKEHNAKNPHKTLVEQFFELEGK